VARISAGKEHVWWGGNIFGHAQPTDLLAVDILITQHAQRYSQCDASSRCHFCGNLFLQLKTVKNNKPPRRFAPCRLDTDDISGRSLIVSSSDQYSCHLSRWPTSYPSFICVELLLGRRYPMTGRFATHPSNTTVGDEMALCAVLNIKLLFIIMCCCGEQHCLRACRQVVNSVRTKMTFNIVTVAAVDHGRSIILHNAQTHYN